MFQNGVPFFFNKIVSCVTCCQKDEDTTDVGQDKPAFAFPGVRTVNMVGQQSLFSLQPDNEWSTCPTLVQLNSLCGVPHVHFYLCDYHQANQQCVILNK